MILRDIHNNYESVRAISPVSISDDTPEVSQIIDTQRRKAVEFITAIGAFADADAVVTPVVDHGDDSGLSDAAAVPDNMLLGTEADAAFAIADVNSTKSIGYVGDKRYVRITYTPVNNTGAFLMSTVAHVWKQVRGEVA